jgi:H+/Cl- antiporter ClcA
MTTEPSQKVNRSDDAQQRSRGYLVLLLVAALIGVPISVIAFGFVAAVEQLENLVWESLPSALGFSEPPAWWAIPTLALAGVLVGLAVRRLPGNGGHVPALGLASGPTAPGDLPGILLAASASLALGAVVGPEAPLLALGGGLAVLSVRRSSRMGGADATAVISAAGSAAAISTILGNPLVASILFLEFLGLGRRQALLVILPCLASSGVGAIVFTGLGSWSGLDVGSLTIPDLSPVPLTIGNVAWAIPIGVAVAVGSWAVFVLGRRTASWVTQRTITYTILAGIAVGLVAALYSVTTGHSPADVALSGQESLVTLATAPGTWSAGALTMLLVCKGIGYGVCLGAFRGGPTFPAVFLGAAVGVLANMYLPGTDFVPSLAVGMAAGTAILGLPVTGVTLVVLVMGDAAADQMPVVILAVVAASIVHQRLAPSPQPSPAD